jgi:glycosyltransferase involved in cell wall biosynthesis
MITVVIPTLDSEHSLVPTLAALVQGSAEGLIGEVLLADGGSTDGTRTIADAAGCEVVSGPPDEGSRLAAAANLARGEWLLFIDPGAVLDEIWTREVGFFIGEKNATLARVATFRLAVDSGGIAPRVREGLASMRFVLLGRPRPEQGLMIAAEYYRSLGGHPPGQDARRKLLQRIDRRRFTAMRTRIMLSATRAR